MRTLGEDQALEALLTIYLKRVQQIEVARDHILVNLGQDAIKTTTMGVLKMEMQAIGETISLIGIIKKMLMIIIETVEGLTTMNRGLALSSHKINMNMQI